MLVCLCYVVSTGEIKKLVQEGKSTLEDVQNECMAGLGCGCCLDALCEVISKEKAS